jgi:hypothetical protein
LGCEVWNLNLLQIDGYKMPGLLVLCKGAFLSWG